MLSEFLSNIYEKTFSGKERVLHFMTLAAKDYSIKEIADSTGQSASNVRRIIKGLETEGIVKGENRRWILVKDLKSAHRIIGQFLE